MEDVEIIVEADGRLSFVHDDDVAGLFAGSESRTRRASHVEPTDAGTWTADLAPVDGPTLGPFVTRREALAAEVNWLKAAMSARRINR